MVVATQQVTAGQHVVGHLTTGQHDVVGQQHADVAVLVHCAVVVAGQAVVVVEGQPVEVVVDMLELVDIGMEYCAETPIAANSESAINATNRAVILFFILYLLFAIMWRSHLLAS